MSTESPASYPFELNGAEFRAAVDTALVHLTDYLDNVENIHHHVLDDINGKVEFMQQPDGPPMEGTELAVVLEPFKKLLEVGYHTGGPGYFSYVPGGGLPIAAIGDLIGSIINRFVGIQMAAPACAKMEANVVDWFASLADFPKETRGGFLTSGGSLANWSAVVTARRCKLPDNFLSGTIYTSSQSHASCVKGAMLAGFPPAQIRKIGVNKDCSISMEELTAAVEKDKADGFTPFLIVANGGTTNTGAVDNMNALADLCAEHDMWLHVDGAYGGCFLATERGKALMSGIERADSLTIDPHKGFFVAYGVGCLVVRDVATLREAHFVGAEYLPAIEEVDVVDFNSISPELTRPFRGITVWLPIMVHGFQAFVDHLDACLDLTQKVERVLKETQHVVVDFPGVLSTVAFHIEYEGADNDAIAALNKRFLEIFNSDGRFILKSTVVTGLPVIRFIILHFRSHEHHVDAALELVATSAAQTIAEMGPTAEA